MKKLLVTSALLTMFSSSAIAKENPFYINFNISTVILGEDAIKFVSKLDSSGSFSTNYTITTDYIDSIMCSIGIGKYITKEISLDVNIAQINASRKISPTMTQNDPSSVEILALLNSKAIIGKIYYDVIDYGKSKFFIGSSIGYSKNKLGVGVNADTTHTLLRVNTYFPEFDSTMWGFNLGVSYNINDNLDMRFEYSYLKYTVSIADAIKKTNPEAKLDDNTKLDANTVSLVFRAYF